MVDKILDEAKKACEEQNKAVTGDYEKDGLLYCCKCNTPKQTRINGGKFSGVYPCMCRCENDSYNSHMKEIREADKLSRAKLMRTEGIKNKGLHNCTFANATDKSKVLELARRYADGWEVMKAKNIGLCFYGDVGSGKTYAAACIANTLIDNDVKVILTDFNRIINDMQSYATQDKTTYIEKLNECELLIIDDFGTERRSEYAFSIIEQVIDERAKRKKPLIMTTNISYQEIKNASDVQHSRLFSRILELTVAVKSVNADKRKKAHQQNMMWAKEYFGL